MNMQQLKFIDIDWSDFGDIDFLGPHWEVGIHHEETVKIIEEFLESNEQYGDDWSDEIKGLYDLLEEVRQWRQIACCTCRHNAQLRRQGLTILTQYPIPVHGGRIERKVERNFNNIR